jgi:putative ABC transport system permease protein
MTSPSRRIAAPRRATAQRPALVSHARSVLRARDVGPLAALGIRTRPARAVLSAAGVAFGIATLVAVFGISSSSRAQLVAEIDALGTNLLTVTPGQSFTGQNLTLPAAAPAMVRRIGTVLAASAIGDVQAGVYRNDRIPSVNTEAITVYSADTSLLRTLQGRMARGRFLSALTARYPAVVLGADAASALGIDRADGSVRVWLGGQWFGVTGILARLPLAPELDRTALIGLPVARRLLHASVHPVQIYVRTSPPQVAAVQTVLAATADPVAPQDVAVTNPADALIARADATAAFQGLFLGLGAVALLVGGIGIANVMVIAVLERRSEIGLRRALGATRRHISIQFLTESAMLAAIGGVAGLLLGAGATAVYALIKHEPFVVPLYALIAAPAAGFVIGVMAGVYPAGKAARLSPTEALRT